MQNPESESTPRNNRIIVAPFDRDQYPEIVAHRGLVGKSSTLIMLSVVSNLLWERLSNRDCRGKNAAPTYRSDSFHTYPFRNDPNFFNNGVSL